MADRNYLMTRPRVGISSCLLGEEVRYDGGHRRNPVLADILSDQVEWVPVCPEFEIGMDVPREPVRLVGERSAPRMIGEESGRDWTGKMELFCADRVEALSKLEIHGFVLKSRSPSCGLKVPVHDDEGVEAGETSGLFARVLREKFPLLPIVEESELEDNKARERWMKKVRTAAILQTAE